MFPQKRKHAEFQILEKLFVPFTEKCFIFCHTHDKTILIASGGYLGQVFGMYVWNSYRDHTR